MELGMSHRHLDDTAAPRFDQPGSERDRSGEQGFSIVEVLIAAVILLFVALGTIPLFTMAMSSNVQGLESTRSANHARERLEQLWQLPFNDPVLTVTAGTEQVWPEYYNESTKTWTASTLSGPDAVVAPLGTSWTRITRVRQFGAASLADADAISASEAATDPARVQIKEITVHVLNLREGGPLGAGKDFVLRGLKAQ